MSEQPIQIHEPDDNEFRKKATKVAAGLLAASAVVSGVAVDTMNRENAKQEISQSYEQEAAHQQAILDEITEKSNDPYFLNGQNDEELITMLPPVDDRTLYGVANESIPEEAKGTYSVDYVLKSTESLGLYQEGEVFAVVGDEIDGQKALLVKRVEQSTEN